jgi:NAD(P)-dependent dehydrogenase (short-subunit alcohol dehydrogenase family)
VASKKESTVARTYVVTGSASGIGRATSEYLEARGACVIGVDLRDATVIADLASTEGRDAMVEGVRAASGDRIDAVVACAGVSLAEPLVVRVNYFGAVATLEGLRPLLARGEDPRAAVVSSQILMLAGDADVVEACLAGDEEAACASPNASTPTVYISAKRALARWVRRSALTPEWAGAGIGLNAIAPGVIMTPMTEAQMADPVGHAVLDRHVPMPYHGYGQPEDAASLLAWLTSPENRLVTGQVIFIDGGSDVVMRGDDIWDPVEVDTAGLPGF